MCGRFTLIATPVEIADFFGLQDVPDLSPRFNIAPSQDVPLIRQDATGARRLALLRWGLIPAWSSDAAIGSRLINARSETAADKPSFRSAFRQRRGLVPASGFFEWKAEGKTKQPFYVHQRNGKPLAIAALWERWDDPANGVIESCTLLTTQANATLRPYHQRMPVFLAAADFDRWLDPSLKQPAALAPLLRPYPDDELTVFPVSTRVNSPRNEGPECIVPLRDGLFA